MRETLFPEHVDVCATPDTDGRCGPLADAVNGDDCGLLERRRIERRCRVRLVVLSEQNAALEPIKMLLNVVGHPELFRNPHRHRCEVRSPAARCVRDVGFEQAIELDQWLFIETDEV